MAEINTQQRNIGIEVAFPIASCADKKCPFHGKLKLHGRSFTGIVKKDIFHKTVTIELQRSFPLRKYERVERRWSRLKAHVPACMNIKKGDVVKIMETKPISKTKTFAVVEVVKQ